MASMRMGTTARWMLLAFTVAALLAIEIRLTHGPRERMDTALRATARWSFVLFWLATCGGALRTLFGARFKPLAVHARDLGLSFASAHLVHLALVMWMYGVADPHLSARTVIVFGIGALWTYLLALLSFTETSSWFGVRTARILRLIGVEYITVVFFIDFNKDAFGGGLSRSAYYAPFLILAAAGPLLRVAAAIRRMTLGPALAAS